jgi:NAD(P)-dependent dehydrogenase (short-subunit alcohol dehydrogenase family)
MSVVFITGPARGIGAALARTLAARGHQLALAGMEPDRLATLAQELGAGHAWFESDVTDQPSLDVAVAGAMRTFGCIDAVVANAGIGSHGSVAVTPVEALARVIEVNLTGVIRTVSATLPHVIAARGYYLLIASAAAIASGPGITAYSAAKAGVEHFGNGLRIELAQKGVDVGVAYPSWIDTDLVRDAQTLGSFTDRLKRLPGPFGKITPLDECATALADAIEKRVRKVFVPKALGRYSAIRELLKSPFAERMATRDMKAHLPHLDEEVVASGRSFGEHSVESRRK